MSFIEEDKIIAQEAKLYRLSRERFHLKRVLKGRGYQ
jgi:hypothetical protein